MYIETIKVSNYKSFLHEQIIELKPGFNIITGQNNAGKTALLEAISTTIEPKPHRSLTTLPFDDGNFDDNSVVKLAFVADAQEFQTAMISGGRSFEIPTPKPNDYPLGVANEEKHKNDAAAASLKRQKFIHFNLRITWDYANQHHSEKKEWGEPETHPSFRVYTAHEAKTLFVPVTMRADQTWHTGVSSQHSDTRVEVGCQMLPFLRKQIYLFRAERFNVGTCNTGTDSVLRPNSSNLAEVLHNLQSNQYRFSEYNHLIREVLPQVRHVATYLRSATEIGIRIWNDDEAVSRNDLGILLDEGGTGVGQVLAMIYVAFNSSKPRIILIDEPHSFLHPGAVRRLIQVLKKFPQHQYVITTHSPTVINAANPDTFTLVKQNKAETHLQSLDPSKAQHLREYLLDIGARLSDVFGYDNILWVEGQTEEACFPLILEGIANVNLKGSAILRVRATGDLEGKQKEAFYTIYDRISKGDGLLPPALAFIFDMEGRTQTDIDDMKRHGKGAVVFINRKLYENYLLNPQAIAAVMNDEDVSPNFRNSRVQESEVSDWIEAHRTEKKYEAKEGENWRASIHGAHLLEDMFKEMSEQLVAYQKTTHSVAITKWLIANSPEELRELSNLLKPIVSDQPSE